VGSSTSSHEKPDQKRDKQHARQDDVSLYSAASGGSGTHRIYSGNAVSVARAFYAGGGHRAEGSDHSSDKTVSLRFQQRDQQQEVASDAPRSFLPLSASEEEAVGIAGVSPPGRVGVQASDPSLSVADWTDRAGGDRGGGSGIEMV
jgi:hypothetical protein